MDACVHQHRQGQFVRIREASNTKPLLAIYLVETSSYSCEIEFEK